MSSAAYKITNIFSYFNIFLSLALKLLKYCFRLVKLVKCCFLFRKLLKYCFQFPKIFVFSVFIYLKIANCCFRFLRIVNLRLQISKLVKCGLFIVSRIKNCLVFLKFEECNALIVIINFKTDNVFSGIVFYSQN